VPPARAWPRLVTHRGADPVDHAIVLQLAQQRCYLQRMSLLEWKLNRHARRLLSPAPGPASSPAALD